MRRYAFIPARSGSKGLPNKNILPIDGHPLLAYAIAFGKQLNVDRVIVSTDSEEYARIARDYGADCPYLRGPAASHDTAMEEDIIADMAQELPRHGIEMPDVWIRLKPTNPFRSVASVLKALDVLERDETIDSARIVSETDCRVVVINSDGFLEPLLSTWDPGRSVMRRSEFPTVYSPFNLDVLRHKNWLELGSAYMGRKIYPIVEHRVTGVDINDQDDFDIVKSIIETRPRPEFLKRYIVDEF
ncbi:MAG: hypothetical protein AAF732_18345 [Pseudomonadota bacterium]